LAATTEFRRAAAAAQQTVAAPVSDVGRRVDPQPWLIAGLVVGVVFVTRAACVAGRDVVVDR